MRINPSVDSDVSINNYFDSNYCLILVPNFTNNKEVSRSANFPELIVSQGNAENESVILSS